MTNTYECSMFGCHQAVAAVWHDNARDDDYLLCQEHALHVAKLLDAQDRSAS